MFAVVVTGAPGSGKTACLTALSDALTNDGIAHAAVDVDEVAWAYPHPTVAERAEHLRAWCESHRRAGRDLVLVSEAIESRAHLGDVLRSVGADDRLVVGLEAGPATLRERIVAREPAGWSGLPWLLDYTERFVASPALLTGAVDLVIDSERHSPAQIAERIRSTRRDWLAQDTRGGPRPTRS